MLLRLLLLLLFVTAKIAAAAAAAAPAVVVCSSGKGRCQCHKTLTLSPPQHYFVAAYFPFVCFLFRLVHLVAHSLAHLPAALASSLNFNLPESSLSLHFLRCLLFLDCFASAPSLLLVFLVFFTTTRCALIWSPSRNASQCCLSMLFIVVVVVVDNIGVAVLTAAVGTGVSIVRFCLELRCGCCHLPSSLSKLSSSAP